MINRTIIIGTLFLFGVINTIAQDWAKIGETEDGIEVFVLPNSFKKNIYQEIKFTTKLVGIDRTDYAIIECNCIHETYRVVKEGQDFISMRKTAIQRWNSPKKKSIGRLYLNLVCRSKI